MGVHSGGGNEKCGTALGGGHGTLVFSYIGWILEQVEGEVCDTLNKIDDWFDGKERSWDKTEQNLHVNW